VSLPRTVTVANEDGAFSPCGVADCSRAGARLGQLSRKVPCNGDPISEAAAPFWKPLADYWRVMAALADRSVGWSRLLGSCVRVSLAGQLLRC